MTALRQEAINFINQMPEDKLAILMRVLHRFDDFANNEINELAIDEAINEAEAELLQGKPLLDAREAMSNLRRKYFG